MKFMEKNVGPKDKAVRIVAGVALLAAFAMNAVSAPLSYLLLLGAIAMFGTAAFGTCTLYTLLGMTTVEKKEKK